MSGGFETIRENFAQKKADMLSELLSIVRGEVSNHPRVCFLFQKATGEYFDSTRRIVLNVAKTLFAAAKLEGKKPPTRQEIEQELVKETTTVSRFKIAMAEARAELANQSKATSG